MSKLTIKAMRGLGDRTPLVVHDYDFVVIEKDGIPLAVAVSLGPELGDAIYVGHVRDADFQSMLRQLGIDKTVIAEDGRKLLLPRDAVPEVT